MATLRAMQINNKLGRRGGQHSGHVLLNFDFNGVQSNVWIARLGFFKISKP